MRYLITDYNETERQRLSALASLVDPFTFHILGQIGLKPGWKCLEIGAGLGTVSQWLAGQLQDNGEVVCTDLQTEFINEIAHPLIRTERLDITLKPPYDEFFDLAVVRALHHHLPDRDAAAQNLIKMVRPGGQLVFIEPDIHPIFSDDHPAWKRAWEAYFNWGERREIDYFTGRRVPGQLADMGLEIVSVRGETALFNGAKTDNPARDVYRMTLDVMLPNALRKGFLSETDRDDVFALLDNPDAWLMGVCFFATHARKPG